jgi:hypothetical protein
LFWLTPFIPENQTEEEIKIRHSGLIITILGLSKLEQGFEACFKSVSRQLKNG